jgi:hypothetical protein
MIDKWTFKRLDETILSANDKSVKITRWSGSSTWERQRWLRDETRPGTLDYYVASVPFRPLLTGENRPIGPDTDLQLGPMAGAVAINHIRPNVHEVELQRAKVPPGLSADEVMAHLDEWQRQRVARIAHRSGTMAPRPRSDLMRAHADMASAPTPFDMSRANAARWVEGNARREDGAHGGGGINSFADQAGEGSSTRGRGNAVAALDPDTVMGEDWFRVPLVPAWE